MTTENKLRDARKKLNLTADRLAKKMGVSTNTIYGWEAGGTPRTPELAKKLHDILGLKLRPLTTAKELLKVKPVKRASRKMKGVTVPEAAKSEGFYEYVKLLGWYQNSTGQRAALVELLKGAQKFNMSRDDLLALFETSP